MIVGAFFKAVLELLAYLIGDGETYLFHVCRLGDREGVHTLFQLGIPVNVTDESGYSCLHFAAREGRHLLVHDLLSLPEIDAEEVTSDGFNPLLLAALNNHTNVVRILLSRKALTIEAVNHQEPKYNFSALHLAAMNHNPSMIQTLLIPRPLAFLHSMTRESPIELSWLSSNAANVDMQTKDGCTALMLASADGDVEVMKALLEANASVHLMDEIGDTALMHAISNGQVESVQVLQQHVLNQENGKNHWLAMLMHTNMQSLFSLAMVASPIDRQINAYNELEDTKAAQMVQLLLAPICLPFNANCDSIVNRPIIASVFGRTLSNVSYALLDAISMGYVLTVQALLELGANPMVVDEDEDNAMILAARLACSVEYVNVQRPTAMQRLLLHFAGLMEVDPVESMKLLAMTLNHRNKNGVNALMAAAISASTTIDSQSIDENAIWINSDTSTPLLVLLSTYMDVCADSIKQMSDSSPSLGSFQPFALFNGTSSVSKIDQESACSAFFVSIPSHGDVNSNNNEHPLPLSLLHILTMSPTNTITSMPSSGESFRNGKHTSIFASRSPILIAMLQWLMDQTHMSQHCLSSLVNAKNQNGETLLYQAAREGLANTAMLLVFHFDADPSIGDHYQVLPEVIAALFGHNSLSRVLHEVRLQKEKEREASIQERLFSAVTRSSDDQAKRSSSLLLKQMIDTCVLQTTASINGDNKILVDGMHPLLSYDSEDCAMIRGMSLQRYYSHLLFPPSSFSANASVDKHRDGTHKNAMKHLREGEKRTSEGKKALLEELLNPSAHTFGNSPSANTSTSSWGRILRKLIASLLVALTLGLNVWVHNKRKQAIPSPSADNVVTTTTKDSVPEGTQVVTFSDEMINSDDEVEQQEENGEADDDVDDDDVEEEKEEEEYDDSVLNWDDEIEEDEENQEDSVKDEEVEDLQMSLVGTVEEQASIDRNHRDINVGDTNGADVYEFASPTNRHESCSPESDKYTLVNNTDTF